MVAAVPALAASASSSGERRNECLVFFDFTTSAVQIGLVMLAKVVGCTGPF
jgi:hypothetical protein